jgi:hypothetical protein
VIEWVTAAEILEQLHVTLPAPEDVTWAELCAGAVNAGVAVRLADAPLITPLEPAHYGDPPAPVYIELRWAALTAGTEAYKRREAVFGLTGYVDMQGAAIRVARDYLEGIAPIIARYATVGIA